jgi:hypothetical protein
MPGIEEIPCIFPVDQGILRRRAVRIRLRHPPINQGFLADGQRSNQAERYQIGTATAAKYREFREAAMLRTPSRLKEEDLESAGAR